MSGQYLGRVTIKVNGEVLDSRPGASIDLGGITRKPVTNDQHMGHAEELKPSRMECELSLRRGASIDGLRNIVDGTYVFECDTGQRYIVKDAYTTDTLSLTGGEGGRVKLVMEGKPAQEIVS